MTSGAASGAAGDLPRAQRRERVCRSWTGSSGGTSGGTSGGGERRHRVCKSWNGYGTLVEEEQEDEVEGGTMKPPPVPGAAGGGGGGGRWIDAMPSLRSLVTRRPPPLGANSAAATTVSCDQAASPSRVPLMHGEASPHSVSTPSMLTLMRHDAYSLPSAAVSFNPLPSASFHPAHRSYNPLPSCASGGDSSDSATSDSGGLRKCSTLVTFSGSSGGPSGVAEAMRPVNRLRESRDSLRMCSRCSSLLSMAASSSRYSLNAAAADFVQVGGGGPPPPRVLCKLCLGDVPLPDTLTIAQCGCAFCKDCMRCYVEFEIQEGAYDISCPDAQCARQGVVTLPEVQRLVSERHMDKYRRFRLNREVDMDVNRLWCPKAGCETVCQICPSGERCLPQSVRCPTCSCDFCSNCKHPWHGGITCEENTRLSNLLTKEPGIPFDNDLIKCCPMCSVPIEKDEGCAQMMCKRCKHVFCWYCLASLDDDFLLRHYDKGPCKNKLGHSRASVIWHRTQVIGIFAGFGILLLVASPLLLLAAPCIVCCKCRVCSGGSKLDAEDDT